MEECTASSQVGAFIFAFLLVFLLHAAPMAWLLRRWRQQYYAGFLPVVFCALGYSTYFSIWASCGIITFENPKMFLSAAFYAVCCLLFVFFKPDLGLGRAEYFFPFLLSIPFFGAAVAVVWLLLSLGRDRLLMDTGVHESLKSRLIQTLMLGGLFILFGTYVAFQELN